MNDLICAKYANLRSKLPFLARFLDVLFATHIAALFRNGTLFSLLDRLAGFVWYCITAWVLLYKCFSMSLLE